MSEELVQRVDLTTVFLLHSLIKELTGFIDLGKTYVSSLQLSSVVVYDSREARLKGPGCRVGRTVWRTKSLRDQVSLLF